MRIATLGILLVLAVDGVSAQPLFTKHYDMGWWDNPKIITAPNNGFYISGGSPGVLYGLLAKVDSSGNMLWSNECVYPLSGINAIFSEGINDGAGNTVFAVQGSYPANGSVVKIDTSGAVLWNLEFDLPVTGITALNDSTFLAVGAVSLAASLCNVGLRLYIVSANGELISQQVFDDWQYTSVWSFGVVQNNGNYYVLTQFNRRVVVFCLSDAGVAMSTLWHKGYAQASAPWSDDPLKILPMQDGSLLICGGDSANNHALIAFNVSADGDVLWSKKYTLPNISRLANAMLEPDGTVLLYSASTGGNVVLRIAADGNLLESKELSNIPSQVRSWLGVNPNGTHSLLYSDHDWNDTTAMTLSFALLDSNLNSSCVNTATITCVLEENPITPISLYLSEPACDDTVAASISIMPRTFAILDGCTDTVTSLMQQLSETPTNSWIYPNPFTNVFQISATGVPANVEYEVVNVLGQRVCQAVLVPVNQFVHASVDLSTAAPGVYIVRLFANGKQFQQKVIKQ